MKQRSYSGSKRNLASWFQHFLNFKHKIATFSWNAVQYLAYRYGLAVFRYPQMPFFYQHCDIAGKWVTSQGIGSYGRALDESLLWPWWGIRLA